MAREVVSLPCLKGTLGNAFVPQLNFYQYRSIKFPVADADAEEPKLLSKSCRKVCKSVLLEVLVLLVLLVVLEVLVLLEVLDESCPEAALSAETRLLKSDFSVARVVSVEEIEDVDELSELVPNWEISCSSLLVKLE